MTNRVVYGSRMAPATTDEQVPKLAKLFNSKGIVSMKDMQRETGKKWVRGFLNAFAKTVAPIVPVKNGRVVLGYRLESKPLEMSKNGTSFRGPDGRFVPVAAAKPKKPATAKRKSKKAPPSEVTPEAVSEALNDVPETAEFSQSVGHEGQAFVPETPAESKKILADLEAARPAPVVPVTSNEDQMDIPAFLRKS